MTIEEESRRVLTDFAAFVRDSPWQAKYYQQAADLLSRFDMPAVIAVAGEVDAGKSSFVNAFLGGDYARTGHTATTATITYFYGDRPEDPERPVKCIWQNGREELMSRAFLDSIQGCDEKTLRMIDQIKELRYYVGNPVLSNVILVDTPGTNALVGEDNQGHQHITDAFFSMCKKMAARHNAETQESAAKADAVIYLMPDGAKITSATFLSSFQRDNSRSGQQDGASHAFNLLGVVTKMDERYGKDETNRREFLEDIERKLNERLPLKIQVYPISAALERFMNVRGENGLRELSDQIKRGFDRIEDLDSALAGDKYYAVYCSKGRQLGRFTANEWNELKRDVPFGVFKIVARTFYERPFDEALTRLHEIAGFKILDAALRNRFLGRARILKLSSLVDKALQLFDRMSGLELFNYRESSRKTRREVQSFTEFVRSHPHFGNGDTGRNLLRFLGANVPPDRTNELDGSISELRERFENLRYRFASVNNDLEGLIILERSGNDFSPEERDELQQLFGVISPHGQMDERSCRMRQCFWYQEMSRARSSQRRALADIARQQYDRKAAMGGLRDEN